MVKTPYIQVECNEVKNVLFYMYYYNGQMISVLGYGVEITPKCLCSEFGDTCTEDI